MLIAIVPVLVALVGVLVFALASNATLKEIGKACMWVGILWTVYVFAGKTIKLP